PLSRVGETPVFAQAFGGSLRSSISIPFDPCLLVLVGLCVSIWRKGMREAARRNWKRGIRNERENSKELKLQITSCCCC
ncbi:unnamed protein product, partial [Musa hybrid cultivar]